MYYPSLSFGAATSDRVDCGNTGTDPTAGSVWLWCYPTDVGGGQIMFNKGQTIVATTGIWRLVINAISTPGSIRLVVDYATTDADARSNTNTLTANMWQFVAATFDGTNAPKIYLGSMLNQAAEVSYGTQTAPSGARVTDGGGSAVWGNSSIGSPVNTFKGKMSFGDFLPGTVLTLKELRWAQANCRPFRGRSKCFMEFGRMGTGRQMDRSGYANHGTLTGPTLSYGLPRIYTPRDFGGSVISAATRGLFRKSNLDGLGAGGSFFSDPVAA